MSGTKMRFGSFIAPFHPIDENPTLALERDFELVQWMDTLGYDEDKMDQPYGSMCKSFICETAYECCHQLLQMWGGSGMMNSTGVNRYFRDARTKLVAEGSTEIHNAAISAVVLGLPTQLGSLMG